MTITEKLRDFFRGYSDADAASLDGKIARLACLDYVVPFEDAGFTPRERAALRAQPD